MNDSKNSSSGLLVVRFPQFLSQEDTNRIMRAISPTAEALGVEPLILGNGADARLESGSSALLERICVALEALVKQGEPPEVSEPQIAPQALNARPTGLNSRPSAPTFNVVEDVSKAGLTWVRTLDSGEQVIDVFVKDLLGG